MVFKLHFPGPPLDHFISSFYYYEGFTPEHSIDCFLPNGETEMIIDLTDRPKYIYDRETLKEIQACHNVWVSGVRTEPICIPSGRDSRMMIVNFKKGGGHPFYPLPLGEITNYVIDADLLFGDRIRELRGRMLETGSIHERFKILEVFLIKVAGDRLHPDVKGECVAYMINYMQDSPNAGSLEELAHAVGYSQKHLIRLFRDRVGVTPKMYMRLLRFQQVIKEIEQMEGHDWLDVAHSCGYFDQAHFIRDFKNFSGFTPSTYALRKNDQLNYIPIR